MSWILPTIPVMASTLAYRFEALFWYVVVVTTIAGLAVYAAMLYFCIAYRRGATTGSTPRILGSTRLEIAWTILPTIIFFSFYGWGVYVFNFYAHPPKDAMEIYVIGKQWMWKAQYPNGQRVIIGGNPRNMTEVERKSIGRLVLPVNRPVKLTLMSEDVIHDFGVPAFRAKMDVLPGRATSVWYEPNRIGEYHIFCDQYCGTWHSLMVGKIAVVSQSDFDDFLKGTKPLQGTQNAVDGSLADRGQKLFLKLQCITCHSADAKARAPVLEGLWGSHVPLSGGGGEIADDDYIRQSILRPRVKLVEGWKAIMPSFEGQVTTEDLNALVEYIKSLKRGTTPDRTEYTNPPLGAPTERPEPKTPSSPEKKP